jgi:hypothetical protein
MSLTTELEKLRNLKDSGAITPEEFERSKKRLLDACVSRIEALHDRKPTAPTPSELPPAKVVHSAGQNTSLLSPQPKEAFADFADAGRPVEIASSSSKAAGAATREEAEQTTSGPQGGGAVGIGASYDWKPPASRASELPPLNAASDDRNIRFAPLERQEHYAAAAGVGQRAQVSVSYSQGAGAVTGEAAGLSKNLPDASARTVEASHDRKPRPSVRWVSPPVKSAQIAVQNIRFASPARSEPDTAPMDFGQRAAAGPSSSKASGSITRETAGESKNILFDNGARPIEAFDRKAPASAPVELPPAKVDRDVQNVRFSQNVRFTPPANNEPYSVSINAGQRLESSSSSWQASGAVTQEEAGQPNHGLPDDPVRLFEAFYDRKPPVCARWGLPPVKVIRGLVQNIRLSSHEDDEQYTASLEVDGQRVDISSPSYICIDPGDRVTLAVYERNGRLMAFAYHNESKGVHPDLQRLRKGYWFLLAVGRVSLVAGLAAIVGTAIFLILHKPVRSFDSALWRYAPYALSGLAAAGVAYFGLGLSSLGEWAKEFHDAMTSRRLRVADPL